jgi:acyl carrier protein
METGTVESSGEDMTQANGVSESIKKFILEKFPLARKRGLKESDPLLESGILDSLGILDVVSFVEHQFAIRVLDEELVPENFQSVEHLAIFVQAKSSSTSTEHLGS